MSARPSSNRVAYLIHGALTLLVVSILGWATATSLRLERPEQQANLERE